VTEVVPVLDRCGTAFVHVTGVPAAGFGGVAGVPE